MTANHLKLLAVVSCFLCMACVHEYPDDNGMPQPHQKIILALDFSADIPLYTVVTYPDNSAPSVSSRSAEAAFDYEMRHTVMIYDRQDQSRHDAFSRAEPLYSYTFFSDAGYETTRHFEIDVPDGDYTVMVWSDHVGRSDHSETFYAPADFSNITLSTTGDYEGSSEWRDAFRGAADFTVPDHDGTPVQTVSVGMTRPLGKFSVIATDVRQFISRSHARADVDPDNFDFTEYYARLVYTGYLPSAFNMYANKPVNSLTGVYFASKIQPVDSENACLAFDYVMVNGTEAKIEAAIQILDRNDRIVAQSSKFIVPLMRSKLTEVRGKFLTATADGGMCIVTEYDGEYNIHIQ